MSINIAIKQLPGSEDLPLPSYATPQSAGVDLVAAVTEDYTLQPGKHILIPSGISIELPDQYEAQIRPRSGLALKHGITLLNAPGTIDADYRGEIGIIVINLGQEAFTISRGMRIAQMVISPVSHVAFEKQDALSATSRGEGGFGSTGIHEQEKQLEDA